MMKLLFTLKSTDVSQTAKKLNYKTYKSRKAARAIIYDGSRIALIHVSAHKYYMLPGGGIDDNSIKQGLKREVREELGAEVEIKDEIGKAILYFDRWATKQTDYCYIVKLISMSSINNISAFEKEEGHEIFWADDIEHAIRVVKSSNPSGDDGKIVRMRDLLFLQEAKKTHKLYAG